MKSFFWILALFCSVFTVQNEVEAKAMPSAAIVAGEAKLVISTIQEGIKTADQALDLYDRVIERVVPWKEFNETLVELDKYRKDYSVESASLIGEIKTLMMNGIDAYFSASQNVYEWTGFVVPQLNAYLRLFDGYNAKKAETQKNLMVQVLDEGIERMSEAQDNLGKSSASFNLAAGKLTALHSRLETEFDEKSEYVQSKMTKIRAGGYASGAWFGVVGLGVAAGVIEGKLIPELKEKMAAIEKFYEHLTEKVVKAFSDIDGTKKALRTEIQHIVELKVQTKTTISFVKIDDLPELRDMVTKSAEDLISKCEAYRKRHINKTDMM